MSTRNTSQSGSPLACPSCGLRYTRDERFCSRCGIPLVYKGAETIEAPLSPSHGRARKVNPAYTEGELVRVAGGRNQAEAELIQGLLLEEGVPSILRRTRGFDVPDFLAAGPRDVLVPQAGVEVAREVLLETELAPSEGSVQGPRVLWLAATILGAGGLAALVAWLLTGSAG